MCLVSIGKQSCGRSDCFELRVAFGDLGNCQLKCVFCFTREQGQSEDQLALVHQYPLDDVQIIRFTGGEPLLSQTQINGITRELVMIENQGTAGLDLVVIQSNGLDVERRDLSELLSVNLPILFELSLKGTNVEEYRYLTDQNPLSTKRARSILDGQMRGYQYLVEMSEDISNISVLARLGIFHSSLMRPMFKFIHPTAGNRLMFDPSDWDPQILELQESQINIWNEIFTEKMVVEKIKTGADGSRGMGLRYRRVIEHLICHGILVEDLEKSRLPEGFREAYFYKRGNEIYGLASNLLTT